MSNKSFVVTHFQSLCPAGWDKKCQDGPIQDFPALTDTVLQNVRPYGGLTLNNLGSGQNVGKKPAGRDIN